MLLSIETPFSIANGNGTMNFMVTLGAVGAMPLGFVLTVLIGAAISALHALIRCKSLWRRARAEPISRGLPYATRLGKRAFSLSRKISANLSKPAFDG
jgi:hypothetical protein